MHVSPPPIGRRLLPVALGVCLWPLFVASALAAEERSSSGPGLGRMTTSEWRQGEPARRLIPADEGLCALLSISGRFAGEGEWAGLWVGKDNFWYLGGRSAQEGVAARCLVIPFATLARPASAPVAASEPADTIWTEPNPAPWRDLKLLSPTEGKVAPNDAAAWVHGRSFPPAQHLGMHAPARMTYTFEEPITQFRAVAALGDGGSMGNVTFQVETESGLVFQSPPLAHRSTTSMRFTIEFPATRTLTLTTLPNGPNYEDWAMWISPQIR